MPDIQKKGLQLYVKRVFITDECKALLPDYLRFVLTHLITNIICVPDFVAYKFADRKSSISVEICRRLWKAQGVSWTLRTQEEYDIAVKEGWIPIFEGFRP